MLDVMTMKVMRISTFLCGLLPATAEALPRPAFTPTSPEGIPLVFGVVVDIGWMHGLAAILALIVLVLAVGILCNWRLRSVAVRSVCELADARERLRQSEERIQALFANASEGVYESTPDDGFISVNPALARIFGHETSDGFMMWARPLGAGLYLQSSRRAELLAALRAHGSVTGFESEVRCADGRTRWISESAWAHRDGNGRVCRLHGFISDITARRLAEATLCASEERYRALLEHSPVAILEYDYREVVAWFNDLRGLGVEDFEDYMLKHPAELGQAMRKVKLVGLNQEAVQLFGTRTKKEFASHPERVAAAGGSAVHRRVFSVLWQGRTELDGDLILKALDGTEHQVHYRWSLPTLAGGPDYAWTQVVIVDMSDIKRVQQDLAVERERLIVTLRAMAEGVITTDRTGRIQFLNEAAERITGWTEGAAVGRPVAEVCPLHHERTQAPVPVPVEVALAGTEVVELPAHTVLSHRRGVMCVVEGRCAPIHDSQGLPSGTVLVLRDITQRARLEGELLRASKLESVGVLAGGIAHDFNNLLTVIMGNLTLALLDPKVAAIAGNWLREAERGALRARDLTGQLLTFAKGGEPVRQSVRLPEIVREAAEFALHGSSVRCDFQEGPGLWPADVDQGQIGQVVQNLVLNAVQAMPEGGIVRIAMQNEYLEADAVRVVKPGNYLRLTIADAGLGIRPEDLSRIFDPYFTTKKTGNGLGLATVYSIIRKHEGHVEVESEMGRGTTFRIWLPAAAEIHPVGRQEAPVSEPVSGRVLFMDDEEAICEMAHVLLGRLGYEVVTVTDGEAVLQAYVEARLEQRPFDVVMMDLTVPGGMGGREAMQELLKLDPDVRGIVLSGYSSDPVMADHQDYGFRARVAKPYRVQDLAKVLRGVLEEPVGH